MRAPAIAFAFVLLAACGGGNGRALNDAGSPSTTSRPGADRTRPPLSFRPVLQFTPGAGCTTDAGEKSVPSHDGSACYSLGAPEVVVTQYGAKESTSGGLLTDGGAVDVTLGSEDLKKFNELAQLCFDRSTSCPTGQLAVVFAGVVRVAPTFTSPSSAARSRSRAPMRRCESCCVRWTDRRASLDTASRNPCPALWGTRRVERRADR